MDLIVQKFGGTSVADVDRIKQAALRTKVEVDAGHHVIVVVSAMAGVTNELVGYTSQMGALTDAREYDVVLSSGEQSNAGLMALALQNLGIRRALGWAGRSPSGRIICMARPGSAALIRKRPRYQTGSRRSGRRTRISRNGS